MGAAWKSVMLKVKPMIISEGSTQEGVFPVYKTKTLSDITPAHTVGSQYCFVCGILTEKMPKALLYFTINNPAHHSPIFGRFLSLRHQWMSHRRKFVMVCPCVKAPCVKTNTGPTVQCISCDIFSFWKSSGNRNTHTYTHTNTQLLSQAHSRTLEKTFHETHSLFASNL